MTSPEEGGRGQYPAWTRRAGITSTLLFFTLAIVYLLLLQKQPYGDGITYLDFLVDGKLAFHHLLYLPTLWVFAQVAGLFGVSLRTAAFAWSAVSAAGAVSLLYYLLQTARSFRIQLRHPLLVALLLATAPSVLFYATQLENHANHLLWVCLFLVILDRALASLSIGPWVLAGIGLVGAYASHSSILLLFPALLLLVHQHWSGRFNKLPKAPEIQRLLLLFLPTLIFKYLIEPWIKGAQGDPNLALDFGREFALSLIEARSVHWLATFLLDEVFLAAFGLWGLFALLQGSRQERRAQAACVLVGLLCYYLLFAHWPVREKGAYFLALLPLVALALGRPTAVLQRWIVPLLLALIVGQSIQGYRVLRGHDESPGPWTRAAHLARVVPTDTVLLCRSGLVQLHLRHDHGLAAHALENWMIGWTFTATTMEDFWDILIAEQILPRLDQSLDRHPLYLTAAGSNVLSAHPGAKKILAALREHYLFEEMGKGDSLGWRLRKRP